MFIVNVIWIFINKLVDAEQKNPFVQNLINIFIKKNPFLYDRKILIKINTGLKKSYTNKNRKRKSCVWWIGNSNMLESCPNAEC